MRLFSRMSSEGFTIVMGFAFPGLSFDKHAHFDAGLQGLLSHGGRAVGHCINELRSRILMLVKQSIVPGSCRRPHC